MRRLFVVLLAVLMLVSFTSCNQDKIDELEKKVAEQEKAQEALKEENEATIKNFEDFMDAFTLASNFGYIYQQVLGKPSSEPVDLDLSTDSATNAEKFAVEDLIAKFITLEDGESVKSCSGVSASGTVKGTNAADSDSNDDVNLTLKDNVIKLKYTVEKNGTEVSEKTDLDFTFTLNGTYAHKEEAESETFSFDVTVNNTAYKVTCAFDYKKDECTSATVNGKNVEVRLVTKTMGY